MPKGIPKDRARRSQLMVVRGKRNQIDREKDVWYAAQQVARGKTYTQIAEELNALNPEYNLTREAVRQDIEKLLVEWKRENLENIDSFITKELYRLEELERIVMGNFEKSKTLRPNEYAALMKRGLDIEEIDEIYSSRELGGDPRYLQVLLNLQAQRLRLLGIDRGNDIQQNTIVNYNFGDMDEALLARMADGLQDGKMRDMLNGLKVDEQ